MTIAQALIHGKNVLQKAGIAEADNDSWLLLSSVLHISRAAYYVRQSEEMDSEMYENFCNLIEIRSTHRPLQYILGTQEFMGYEFEVDENVLIPRQDTEILVEEVLKVIQNEDEVLDMCTGSGCIILSIAKEADIKRGVGADLSQGALEVAGRNRQRLGVSNVELVHSNLFENVTGTFDVIVSNPPYIKTAVIEGLMEEVRQYEPFMALDGHDDGLYFYRRITKEAVGFLRPGGYLFYEIGYDQGQEVAEIMRHNGYEDIRIIKDLAGLDRVVRATRP